MDHLLRWIRDQVQVYDDTSYAIKDFAHFFDNMQKMNYHSNCVKMEDVNIELADVADPEINQDLL